ncbi:MAG: adenylosuccinate lyase [Ilumatobacteraceae bacterium]
MIERYSRPEMAAVWRDTTRFGRWLEVELLATEAQARLGIVPTADAVACRQRAPTVDDELVGAITERERTTDHDVAAFVDVVQQRIGPPAGTWIHHGLTSSDVVDTALCWAMRDAIDVILAAVEGLLSTTIGVAREHLDTVMVGRTHGVHAEPTTFGAKVALWALQLDRDRRRLRAAREVVAVCKLSGAVGTYSNVDPAVEADVGAQLGLRPVPASQVISRDRHAEFLWALAAVAATCELVAVELRHLQRTEVAEVREGFKPGQKGSSAMPHKRNPISAETISGLARVVRSNLMAGLQDVALWHERDISHSSVERIVLPDSALLVDYVVVRLRHLLSDMYVDAARMESNLWSSHGLVFSQPVLLALVAGGMPRDDAYRLVQASAMIAADEGIDFRTVLERDATMTLDATDLDEAFDLRRAVRHVQRLRAQLDGVDHRT